MAFRRNGKERLAQRRAYAVWLADNRTLLERAGLPDCVTRSRDDWAYFALFRYHQVGNWHTPPNFQFDFQWEDLNESQQRVVEELLVRWEAFCTAHPILYRLLVGDEPKS
jgi:hypothetical protein